MTEPRDTQTLQRYIRWAELRCALVKLTNMLPPDSIIYGIPRGGALVALLLSYLRDDLCVTDVLNRATVIVDDVIDSGRTMQTCLHHHYNFARQRRATTACLYQHQLAQVQADHHAEFIKDHDTWIIFPWDKGALF